MIFCSCSGSSAVAAIKKSYIGNKHLGHILGFTNSSLIVSKTIRKRSTLTSVLLPILILLLSNQMILPHLTQLALVVMDLLSMLDVDLPAFMLLSNVHHLQTLIQEGHGGSLIKNNESSSLFSNPFQDAYNNILSIGAVAVTQNADCSYANVDSYHIPAMSILQ